MRRTLNEVYRMCQKAAEGAGAPAGLDMDAAESAAWLAARGLDPLAGFAAHLEAMSGRQNPSVPAVGDGDPQDLDASGKAGTLVASALVDLLAARAMAGGGTGRLRVTGLSAPLFLLPRAARYAEDGWVFRLTLADTAGRHFVLTAAPEAGVAITGPAGVEAGVESVAAALSGPAPFDLEAVCARTAAPQADQAGTSILAEAASLEAAAARSLSEGVAVEPGPWGRLQAFMAKVLVPATAESRRRGAGARLSDNE